jgi:hypothetical protein
MTATMTTPDQRPTEQLVTEQPQPAYYPYSPGPVQWVPQPAPTPRRGLAITGLVLGIIGVVLGLTPLTFWVALPLGVLGLIFGVIGFRHGMGKAGAILGGIAILLGIIWAVAWNNAINETNNDLNTNTGAAAAIQMVNTS